MNIERLEPGKIASCEPLTCTRDLGDCPVANRPLAAVQLEKLERAGFTVSANLRDGVFIRGDAWLSQRDLIALAGRTGVWTLRDADGCALAWSGPRDGNGPEALDIPAGEGSFHIRYPWDLLAINERLLAEIETSRIDGSVYAGSHIEGTLILGPGSRLLPGVFVEGVVVIGADCKIGPNCYLRGATCIGDRCHIGQSVEVKNSIVMSDTAIGHLSYCGDSILGEHVNFGAGTMCANFRHDGQNHRSSVGGVLVDTGRRKFGAILGDNVHTGIHTSIYPGRKIWPGLSTRPGDIVQRDLIE
jgi:NDP-sugar pyrophosphorylase family protein